MATWSKKSIEANIISNLAWLYRGIIAIYERQTADEQNSGITRHDNGIGFNGCDAEILSSFAVQIKMRGTLSHKQQEIARKKMVKYCGQLEKIANGKL